MGEVWLKLPVRWDFIFDTKLQRTTVVIPTIPRFSSGQILAVLLQHLGKPLACLPSIHRMTIPKHGWPTLSLAVTISGDGCGWNVPLILIPMVGVCHGNPSGDDLTKLTDWKQEFTDVRIRRRSFRRWWILISLSQNEAGEVFVIGNIRKKVVGDPTCSLNEDSL